MAKIKCDNCDYVFDEEELSRVTELHGEEHSACPCCGIDDFTELKQCEICGEWFDEDELIDDTCKECQADLIEAYNDSMTVLYEISKQEKSAIYINNFLVELFGEDEIEKILLDRLCGLSLKEREKKGLKFIENDRRWFLENIKDWRKKNEIK